MGLFTFTKRSSKLFPGDPGLLYEVLTDYDVYSEWMPLIGRSKLLAKEGDLAIAEFELLLPPKDLFVVECIHTKNKMVLWRTIRGRVPISEVRWDIEPGADNQTRVSLVIEGKMSWARFVRAYSRFITTSRWMKALQSQISAFLPQADTGDEGEKILEIAETSEGLVCWMQGKKYLLTPASEGSHD